MIDPSVMTLATVAATAVTAVATGVLAWFTWNMASATRRMAEATRAPAVTVTLEPSRWSTMHLDLLIENSGNSAAYDVNITFDVPLQRNGDGKEVATPRIPLLRPGYPIRNFIGEFNHFTGRQHKVTVSWLNAPQRSSRTEVSYSIDLSMFEGVHILGSGDPDIILAQEVKKLREAVAKLGSSTHRFQVDTRTHEDRVRERAEWDARHAEQKDD